jgi:oligosaccharide repeat unit polymerase
MTTNTYRQDQRRQPRTLSATVSEEFPLLARIFLPSLFATIFLWFTSPNEVSFLQWFAAFVILFMSWGSYCRWRARKQNDIPLFSMISFIFWLYYAFPLFWGNRLAVSLWNSGEAISNSAVTGAMLMAVLGVFSMWLGTKSGIGRRWSPQVVPDIPHNQSRWSYLRLVMIVGCLLGFFEESIDVFGEELRQVVYIFLNIVPLVPFAIIFRHYLQGKASRLDKILIVAFLCIRCIMGMSSGWLGTLVYLMITCAAIYIAEKKKIPRMAVVLLILYVLFFQVGKFSLRQKYWYEQDESSKIERITFWMNESLDKWGETLGDPSGESLRDMTYQSLSRVSLLTQTANVLELTPSIVPYQYGRLYSYMVVALIPRFVWPNKPSANDANKFYQVSYGITAEDDLDHSSFAAGLLAESYINFSWFGVVGMMFLIGIFLDFFQKTFLSASSGLLLRGIGVVLLPYLLSIESQLAVYMGATIQRIVFILLVLLPIISLKKTGRPAAGTFA